MRHTFIALGAIGSLSLVLAGCGGGGAGTTPAVQSAGNSVPSGPINPVQKVVNFTGPGTQVAVTIHVPTRGTPLSSAAKAQLHKRYGTRVSNANIRKMYNTSPSASIRAAGLQQNRYAQHVQATTRRGAQYVSGATDYLEFVVTDANNNVLVDETAGCSSESCTNSFDAPVGSGYTVSLFLYDYCDFLLSAGSVANNTFVAGTNAPITVTLNGVVNYFYITADNAQLYSDASAATTFNVTVVAVDADNDTITTPGYLVDNSFTKITGVTLTNNVSDAPVTGTGSPTAALNAGSDLSFPITNYSFAGTGSEGSIDFTATPITTGSPIVTPGIFNYGDSYETSPGYGSLGVTPPQLSWTNPNGIGPSSGTFDPLFSFLYGTGNTTYASLEFPGNQNDGSGIFGLQENLPSVPSDLTITITDNGYCAGIASYSNAPTLYTTIQDGGVDLTAYAINGTSNSCQLIATDSATPQRTAYLNIYYDNSSLTIQNKARRAK